jgi:hypothetical protein
VRAGHRDAAASHAPRDAPMPDARRYRLAIDAEGRRTEITAADPIAHPQIAALIDFVRERGVA